MTVSIIDGSVAEVEPIDSAPKSDAVGFKRIIFDTRNSGRIEMQNAVAATDLGEHLKPGTSGRFYGYDNGTVRGIHGFRDSGGVEIYGFAAAHERKRTISHEASSGTGSSDDVSFALDIFSWLMVFFRGPVRRLAKETRQQFELDSIASDNLPS